MGTDADHSGAHSDRHGSRGGRAGDRLDRVVLGILLLLVTLPSLPLGSVAPWATILVCYTTAAATTVWLLAGAMRGSLYVPRTAGLWLLFGFAGIVFLQLVPLAPGLLAKLSPRAAELYGMAFPAYPANGEHVALSLTPAATRLAFGRLLSLVLVGGLTASVIRTRQRAQVLLWALIAIATFEALYGFAEHFSGHNHIFWVPREQHLAAVTGTHHNKNHFAGLLAMVLPVALGLLLAKTIAAARRRGGTATTGVRGRLALILSSSTTPVRLLLAFLCLVMVVGIFFSLSRAGSIACGISLVVLAAFISRQAGLRRYTLLLLGLVALAVLVIGVVGMDLVAARLEDVTTGPAGSWIMRLQLARDAIPYARDFLVTGSGFGSFREVYPSFQSAYLGDTVARYLHDDWFQVLLETGLPGLLVLALGLGLLVSRPWRMAATRKSSFSRWVTVGALLGVGAMLVHSFFDFNLYKITANAVIFAVLLGLAHAVAFLPGRRDDRPGTALGYYRVRVRSFWRVLPAAAAVGVVALVVWQPYLSIQRRLVLARYLRQEGRSDRYFFLDKWLPDEPVDADLAAAAASPYADPDILYAEGRVWYDKADDIARQKAQETLARMLGDGVATMDQTTYQQLFEALVPSLRAAMTEERRPKLETALALIERGLRAAPTAEHTHRFRLSVLAQLDLQSERLIQAAAATATVAVQRPRTNYIIGQILAVRAAKQAPDKPLSAWLDGAEPMPPTALPPTPSAGEVARAAVHCLREAIYANSHDYAMRSYGQLLALEPSGSLLVAVTPPTLGAQRRLARALWDRRDYASLLTCLDLMDRLGERLPESGQAEQPWWAAAGREPPEDEEVAPEDIGPRMAHFDSREHVRFDVLQLRAEVYGVLGRWDERQATIAAFRRVVRQGSGADLADARRLRYAGRLRDAYQRDMEILARDWGNPDAAIEAAELARFPGVLPPRVEDQSPEDHLFRMVIGNVPGLAAPWLDSTSTEGWTAPLAGDQQRRVEHLLHGSVPPTDRSLIRQRFILAACAYLSGDARGAIEQLGGICRNDLNGPSTWMQGHLSWYVLGLAHEQVQQPEEAAVAYAQALAMRPTLWPAAQRYLALAGEAAAAALELREASVLAAPATVVNDSVGGAVTLIGYSYRPPAAPLEPWTMQFYWQLNDRLTVDKPLGIQVLDQAHQLIARHFPGPLQSKLASNLQHGLFCGELMVTELPVPVAGDKPAARLLRLRSPYVGGHPVLNELSQPDLVLNCAPVAP